VDIEDLPVVLQSKWNANRPHGRITKSYAHSSRKGKRVLMHRLLVEVPPGMEVDHDDGDGLNNRRQNLIVTTHSKNLHNRTSANKSSVTGVRGVTLRQTKYGRRYHAAVTREGVKRVKVFPATPQGLKQAERYLKPLQRRDAKPRPAPDPRDKLSADARRAIHERHANGERTVDLAREFGVARTTISRLLHGHIWKRDGLPQLRKVVVHKVECFL
jgi:hypothetical protein